MKITYAVWLYFNAATHYFVPYTRLLSLTSECQVHLENLLLWIFVYCEEWADNININSHNAKRQEFFTFYSKHLCFSPLCLVILPNSFIPSFANTFLGSWPLDASFIDITWSSVFLFLLYITNSHIWPRESYSWGHNTRWFKYDWDWVVCKQAALRSSCETLREWSHNFHPPSCSG